MIGYLDKFIKPLLLILPKMRGYVKTFKIKDGDKDNKLMSFRIDDKDWRVWNKKYLLIDYYTLDKVLDNIKRTGIEKLDDIRTLIDTDDKWTDDIILKNAVILMTCVIKDGHKVYSKLYLKESLYDE